MYHCHASTSFRPSILFAANPAVDRYALAVTTLTAFLCEKNSQQVAFLILSESFIQASAIDFSNSASDVHLRMVAKRVHSISLQFQSEIA